MANRQHSSSPVHISKLDYHQSQSRVADLQRDVVHVHGRNPICAVVVSAKLEIDGLAGVDPPVELAGSPLIGYSQRRSVALVASAGMVTSGCWAEALL